jgi:hypothetical protein
MLMEGSKSVGKIFILDSVLDIIYQFIVQRRMSPFEVVLVALILAIVPYLIIRGESSRVVK